MAYQIEAKDGTVYGYYRGDTPEEAWQKMVDDAMHGSDDYDAVGTIRDWIVTEAEIINDTRENAE